jgi:FkbM family methyltransferase
MESAIAGRFRAIRPPSDSPERIAAGGTRGRVRLLAGRLLARRFESSGGWRVLAYVASAPRFATLAHGIRARARIVVSTIWLALAEAVPGAALRRTLRVPVDHRGRRMLFEIAGLSELEVLDEVFLQGEYEIALSEPPCTIVDLGSHIGASLLAFSTRFPQARLVGVEANRDTFARLQANTRMLCAAQLRNVAVTGRNGIVSLRAGRDSWASSVLAGESGRGDMDVPSRTLSGLIEDLGLERIDLLKVDIEGAEYEAFASFDRWDMIGTIVLEWHGDMIGRPVSDLRALLPRHEVVASSLRDAPGRYFVRADPIDG